MGGCTESHEKTIGCVCGILQTTYTRVLYVTQATDMGCGITKSSVTATMLMLVIIILLLYTIIIIVSILLSCNNFPDLKHFSLIMCIKCAKKIYPYIVTLYICHLSYT